MNGLETPKYYVTESNGVRTLNVGGTTTVANQSSSGGAISFLVALFLGSMIVIRRNKLNI